MRDNKVAVVIPCYRATEHIQDVIKKIPEIVNTIYCVDDACPNNTGKLIKQKCKDKRIKLLFNESNLGVGGAMIRGYKEALKDNQDIIVKIDADNQMDPSLIPMFIKPIVNGLADYTKGNRFYSIEGVTGMPKIRIIGNAVLSFLSKLSTGYWSLFDPNNGYTAIHAKVLRLIPLEKVSKKFFFESDMLFRLNTLRALVLDIPMQAQYGNEKSNLSIQHSVFEFSFKHVSNFFKRLFYNYYLRDFSVASIQWFIGPILLIYGIIYGLDKWAHSVITGLHATAGQVMNAALPTIVGLQLFLSALNYDMENKPTIALHTLISKD